METEANPVVEALGLTDDQLATLLEHVRIAERGGRIREARELLGVVIAELNAAGYQPLEPIRWIARLECELGEYPNASRWLEVGRDVAVEAGHAIAIWEIDLALARVAIAANDLAEAERRLAQIPIVVGPPPPTASTATQVVRWAAGLTLTGDRLRQAALRAEAGFTVMDLWRAAGRYRSALELLSATRAAVVTAHPRAQIAGLDLLEGELLFEAGEIDAAWQHVTRLKPRQDGPEAARHAVVSARIAMRGGKLSDARRISERPVATEDPVLLGQAAAVRIAVLNELNQYDDAHAEAIAAAKRLADQAPSSPVRAMLDRAAAATNYRAHTAVASWDRPWVPEQVFPREIDDIAAPTLIAQRRKHDAWIPLLDELLVKLEANDLPAARTVRDRLVDITRGVESRYIAARVRVACALVDYHDAGPTEGTLDDLLAVASELHDIGARLAELQAVRFAAWSAARLDRADDHHTLANRALAITDDIATKLDYGDRMAFLMNKWSGRDEVVMRRLDQAIHTAPRRGRRRTRMLSALFREVERLTCWPVDDALGTERARGLGREATSDQVAQWIAVRRGTSPGPGFVLHSPWSLWRFPLGTVALHYHVLPDRIVLFRFSWRRIETFLIPVSRAMLDHRLATCLADIRNDQSPRAVADGLHWLAQMLGVHDAIAAFPRARRLVVIAHDVIANVPFAALPVDGRALCEQVAISHIDRLSRLRRRGPRAIERFIGLGIRDYEPAMPDLPHAEHEVTSIAAMLGLPLMPVSSRSSPATPPAGMASLDGARAGTRLGPEATSHALMEALASASHVHVAAHGMFDLDDPAASRILMHDSAVSLRDLRGLHARDLRVVALSTCWSAEAATLPGRERICLPTALLDAGARAVVASLWEVGDASSGGLMREMYQGIRKHGAPAALTAAQAARVAREPLCNWAGFLCYGSD